MGDRERTAAVMLGRARWWSGRGVRLVGVVAAVLVGGAAAGRAAEAEAKEAAGVDWPPAAAELSDADVSAAIDAITAAMLAEVDPRTGWDPSTWTTSWGSTSQGGGYTALAALALVRAGVSPQTAGLDTAIDLVRAAPMEGTYAVASRACLLSRLPPSRREGLDTDIRRLLEGLHPETGGWGYRVDERRARRDNSLRQFGALALWDAANAGVPIPRAAWERLDAAFRNAQRADGGWNYTENDEPSRGSLTAAAVATLMITDERLGGQDAQAAEGSRRRAIERGIAWLDRRFDHDRNPGSDKWYHYYAYSIERVGLAAGLVTLGGRDWYRELARESIQRTCRRRPDGTIEIRRDRRNRIDDLAFTLLLLSRGRVPLVAGKLVIPGTQTDARPRDVGRLARITGEALESEAGWRRVALSDPLEAWLSVPVLACSGEGRLPKDASVEGSLLRDRMRAFLDAGGWLLVVDEGDGRFTRDFESLISELRPAATTARADDDHPAYGFHRDPGRRLPVQVVSDGVRDLAVLLRGDDWLAPPPIEDRGGRRARRAGRAPAAPSRGRINPHEAVLVNLALAATADVPPGPRLAARPGDPRVAGRAVLATFNPAEDDADVPARRLVRLRHAEGWNVVPGADEVFAAWAAAAGAARLTVGQVIVTGESLDAGDAPALVLVAGATAPSEAEAARIAAAIGELTAAGTPVLVTTAGAGDGVFSRAVEAALMAGGARAPRRALADAMLAGGPIPVNLVQWTQAMQDAMGPRPTEPRIRGTVTAPGAATVLISHEDLLVGVLGRGGWGVRGYAPSSARRVLGAMVLASGRIPPPVSGD